jgi:predicted extracellular nuclease
MTGLDQSYRNLLPVLLLGILVSCAPLKSLTPRRNLTVVFYNVENLFDTKDQQGKNDNEFTPDGEKKWDHARYQKKLNDLSRVIAEINTSDLPEIVGLCEVENEVVVKDLMETGLLQKGKYSVVHHESPDIRGIDCALIYRPAEFTVLSHSAIRVVREGNPRFKTRDILYVKGLSRNKEEFHIFVNHWPSRIGGTEETEPSRVVVARLLRTKVDSVMNSSPEAHIIVMGDMNDEPDNSSLKEVLGAMPPGEEEPYLVNLMFPAFMEGEGSYNYRGDWNMLDHLVISPGLLQRRGFRCTDGRGFVYRSEWMEYSGRNGVRTPNRTYSGQTYTGGVSDHFPVYFRMRR